MFHNLNVPAVLKMFLPSNYLILLESLALVSLSYLIVFCLSPLRATLPLYLPRVWQITKELPRCVLFPWWVREVCWRGQVTPATTYNSLDSWHNHWYTQPLNKTVFILYPGKGEQCSFHLIWTNKNIHWIHIPISSFAAPNLNNVIESRNLKSIFFVGYSFPPSFIICNGVRSWRHWYSLSINI